MATNLQQDSENLLREKIGQYGLESFEDDILSVARESIVLVVKEELSTILPGQSRIGGPPDLENESQWPSYSWASTTGLGVFYFQLNLADLPLVAEQCLPAQGMLSVFTNSQILADEGCVLYLREPKSLKTQRMPDLNEFADGDLDEFNRPACYHHPRKITPRKTITLPGYMFEPDCIDDEHLDRYFELIDDLETDDENLGLMYSQVYQGLPEEDDASWYSLFNLHSNSKYFSFGDHGNTAISVTRNSAKAGDFSQVRFDYCE